MTKPAGLALADTSGFDLLVKRCPNGHLHVFGFYGQIREEQKTFDLDAMTVTIWDECSECECKVPKTLRLIWDPSVMMNGAGI